MVFLDKLAAQLIVLALEFLLSLVTNTYTLLQVFDLFLLEGYSFFEGDKFTFDDGIAGCKGIGLSLQRGDGAFELIGNILDMFVLLSPLLKKGLAETCIFVFEVIYGLLGLLVFLTIS